MDFSDMIKLMLHSQQDQGQASQGSSQGDHSYPRQQPFHGLRHCVTSSSGYQGKKCANCGCINLPLKRCSACKEVYYCSVECQRADWALHKKVCTFSK